MSVRVGGAERFDSGRELAPIACGLSLGSMLLQGVS
jgi:hypothetical protein